MKDEALRLALSTLNEVRSETFRLMRNGQKLYAEEKVWNAITAIKQALEQPEPEPVVWRNAALRVGEDLCSVGPFGYYDMTAEQWLDWALSVVTVHTPPPQHTWQGLTDEQIMEMYNEPRSDAEMIAFARAIEAAHGIGEQK